MSPPAPCYEGRVRTLVGVVPLLALLGVSCVEPAEPDAGTVGLDSGSTDAGSGITDAGPLIWPPLPPQGSPTCALRDTTAFRLAGTLPVPVMGAALLRVGDWLYILPGGSVDGTSSDETWLAPIAPDGTLGPVVRGPPRPDVFSHAGRLVRMGDRLYEIGGDSRSKAQYYSERVFSAPIGADGVIGEWSVEASLLTGRQDPAVVVLGDALLVLGGTNAGKGSTAQTAELSWVEGGSLRPWARLWRDLTPWYAYRPGAARVGDHVYYGSVLDSLRIPLSTLGPVEPTGPVIAPIHAHGRTLIGRGLEGLYRTPILDDGSVGEAVPLASFPPLETGRQLDLWGATVTADDELAYLVGGLGEGRPWQYFSDEVWVAPLCVD